MNKASKASMPPVWVLFNFAVHNATKSLSKKTKTNFTVNFCNSYVPVLLPNCRPFTFFIVIYKSCSCVYIRDYTSAVQGLVTALYRLPYGVFSLIFKVYWFGLNFCYSQVHQKFKTFQVCKMEESGKFILVMLKEINQKESHR